MTPAEIIAELEGRGVTLQVRDGKLFATPRAAVSAELAAEIAATREALIAAIAGPEPCGVGYWRLLERDGRTTDLAVCPDDLTVEEVARRHAAKSARRITYAEAWATVDPVPGTANPAKAFPSNPFPTDGE